MILSVLLTVPILVISFSIYMLIRNKWIFTIRQEMIDECYNKTIASGYSKSYLTEEFEKYPNYNQMLNRFWCWDIEKLKRGK